MSPADTWTHCLMHVFSMWGIEVASRFPKGDIDQNTLLHDWHRFVQQILHYRSIITLSHVQIMSSKFIAMETTEK